MMLQRNVESIVLPTYHRILLEGKAILKSAATVAVQGGDVCGVLQ